MNGVDPATTATRPAKSPANGPATLYLRMMGLCDRLPLSFVLLVSRLAVAHLFWVSAQSKRASWPTTIQLFRMEYRLPWIEPGAAATLATGVELCGSLLLVAGLLSRLAALLLLFIVATIQIFVYPANWGEHLIWAAPLLLILARGAGGLSIDHVVFRLFHRKS